MLPDGNGVHLAVQLRKRFARLPVVVMSGMALHAEEAAIWRKLQLPDALQAVPRAGRANILQALLLHGSAERAKGRARRQKLRVT